MPERDQETLVTDVSEAAPRAAANDCLVVIHRREGPPGKVYRLPQTPVRIGRGSDNEIVLDDEGVSRRHARLERWEGGRVLSDVGSTNGTLINDHELTGGLVLANGDRIKIGSAIFKYLIGSDIEAELHEQIYQNTVTDNLTGLANKFHFGQELEREFSRSRRHERPLSLLVIDIDHFKQVNDNYGHHVGDIALQAVAEAIRRSLRSDDIVARYGGEEIVVLLPETSLDQAQLVAEKVRQAVEEQTITCRNVTLHVTVSVGCAEVLETDADANQFFERCDKNVYAAKNKGRNCVSA